VQSGKEIEDYDFFLNDISQTTFEAMYSMIIIIAYAYQNIFLIKIVFSKVYGGKIGMCFNLYFL
jgi:hypothetical protein